MITKLINEVHMFLFLSSSELAELFFMKLKRGGSAGI